MCWSWYYRNLKNKVNSYSSTMEAQLDFLWPIWFPCGCSTFRLNRVHCLHDVLSAVTHSSLLPSTSCFGHSHPSLVWEYRFPRATLSFNIFTLPPIGSMQTILPDSHITCNHSPGNCVFKPKNPTHNLLLFAWSAQNIFHRCSWILMFLQTHLKHSQLFQ